MQLIETVKYHNGRVLNGSDRDLIQKLSEGYTVIFVVPILEMYGAGSQSASVTSSIQYILQEPNTLTKCRLASKLKS